MTDEQRHRVSDGLMAKADHALATMQALYHQLVNDGMAEGDAADHVIEEYGTDERLALAILSAGPEYVRHAWEAVEGEVLENLFYNA